MWTADKKTVCAILIDFKFYRFLGLDFFYLKHHKTDTLEAQKSLIYN